MESEEDTAALRRSVGRWRLLALLSLIANGLFATLIYGFNESGSDIAGKMVLDKESDLVAQGNNEYGNRDGELARGGVGIDRRDVGGDLEPGWEVVYHVQTCDGRNRLGEKASCVRYENEKKIETPCGTVPIEPKHCYFPSSGTYEYSKSLLSEIDSLETRAELMCQTWEDLGTETVLTNLGAVKNGSCELIRAFPLALLNTPLKGKSIVFLGSSHLRNVVSGMIAHIRGMSEVVERHEAGNVKKIGSKRFFQFWKDRDEAKFLDETEQVPQYMQSENQDPESISIIHVWAEYQDVQAHRIKAQLPLIKPDFIVTSLVAGHDKNPDLIPEWQEAWTDYFQHHGNKLIHFVYFHWPFGDQTGRIQKIKAILLQWQQRFGLEYSIFDFGELHSFVREHTKDLIGDKQLVQTWHSACSCLPTYESKSDNSPVMELLVVEAGCPDPFDRFISRLLLTKFARAAHTKS